MRKITRKGLIKKLDGLVTKILLLQDKKCVICGSDKQLGTGHIFSRTHLETRWDIEPKGNCHIQCWSCNFRHVRNTYPYNNWFIKKHGEKEFDNLYQRWNKVCKAKQFQLEVLAKSLQIILDELEIGGKII
jgi:hypothetical protein